ncbi:MAG: PH domain-containing protein [Actinomycetota bacterium]|nr:PH domain-containing protein [Actinomycetota bacterium]MDQ2956211.1 PH domain-containing protein [Actinomycetota bacterium]
MTAIQRTVLKHPASAYLIVAFVALCVTAVVRSPLQALVYLVPAAGALYVARTATIVDERGLHAQAVFGSQLVGWDELHGLRLDSSGAVYAVDLAGTQLRLPCVRSTKLQPLIAAGGGRIPALPEPE